MSPQPEHQGGKPDLALRKALLTTPSSERNGMLRNGGLTLFATFANGLTRFASSVVVGRSAGPSALGIFQVALSTAQLLSLLWPTAAGSAASKFVARARGRAAVGELEDVTAHLARRAVQASVVLAGLSAPVWLLVTGGSLASAAPIVVLVLGLSLYSFSRGLLYGGGLIRRSTVWDVATAVAAFLSVAVAVLAGARGTWLILPVAMSYLAFALINWPWGIVGSASATLRHEMDWFILLGVVGTLASTGFLQLSMLVSHGIGGSEGAGQFAAALALASPPALLGGALSLVLFPALSEAAGRQDHAMGRDRTDTATAVLAATMIMLFGLLIVFKDALVSLTWGQEFQDAQTILPILLFAILGGTLAIPSVSFITSGSQRGMVISAASSSLGLVVGALGWLGLVPERGVVGVAEGYLVGALVSAGIPITVAWKSGGQHWGGLALRVAGGVSLILYGMLLVRPFGTDQLWNVALALAFVGGCVVLFFGQYRDLLRRLRAAGPSV